jgi:rare lipoprotein A
MCGSAMKQRKRPPVPAALLLLLALPGSALSAAEAIPTLPYQPLDGFVASDSLSITPPAQELGTGIASYYGRQFAGRRTASGEIFDPSQLTAAHRTLPFGSMVEVTKVATGKSVVVRINDRGPFGRGRTIDVSEAAARELGLIGPGHGAVRLTLLDPAAARYVEQQPADLPTP